MTGPHYLNFLNQLMAIWSSSDLSHLWLGTFHILYKHTTDTTYITESGRKKNKYRLGLAPSARKEKVGYFSCTLCFWGFHKHVLEQNSHTATRNADSSQLHARQLPCSDRRLSLTVANPFLLLTAQGLAFPRLLPVLYEISRARPLCGFHAKADKGILWHSHTHIHRNECPPIVPHSFHLDGFREGR